MSSSFMIDISAQRETLGEEKLKELRKQLEEANAKNNIQPPHDFLGILRICI